MARTFEKGQQVMVKRWGSMRTGDHWEAAAVVEPVGRKVGSDWNRTHAVGAPRAGAQSYVEVNYGARGLASSYTAWVVNARNKILSLEDYGPIVAAQELREEAAQASKRRVAEREEQRYKVMAEFLHLKVLGGARMDEIEAILKHSFKLTFEGTQRADLLIAKAER